MTTKKNHLDNYQTLVESYLTSGGKITKCETVPHENNLKFWGEDKQKVVGADAWLAIIPKVILKED